MKVQMQMSSNESNQSNLINQSQHSSSILKYLEQTQEMQLYSKDLYAMNPMRSNESLTKLKNSLSLNQSF